VNQQPQLSELVKVNGFSQRLDGVFQLDSVERSFDYSDGEVSEATLYQILSEAEDLSSDSAELQAQITDWPTEYHLSSSRANLLRPLNLRGSSSDLSSEVRVLELGCGCGSISRFLGEQEGFVVDSVEGSPSRAGLAALRCRDLENVSISTANFNDIEFPENYYDLVLFVGVTEYAGRFSTKETDQEALADLLNIGKRAAKESGIVLVAIENRLGLKYLLGASEDHYAIPYVGLDDYPNSTGIRTYSQQEWRDHANVFSNIEFMYPFPDYKVPTAVLRDTGAESASLLEGRASRDYSAAFDAGDDEHRIWQGLAQTGSLGEHANSFLIALSDNSSSIERVCDFTAVSYPISALAYDIPKVVIAAETASQLNDKMERHLNAQIIQLKSHSESLEARVEIMSNSIGWRLLSGVRRLFGKTSF